MKRISIVLALFMSIASTNIYACPTEELDNKAITVQDNWTSDKSYVSQFESSNYPQMSCVSASVKMLCNELCTKVNKECELSVTDISKLIKTTSEYGAYLSDGLELLNEMNNLEEVTVYRKDEHLHKRLTNMFNKSFIGIAILDNKSLPHYDNNYSANHCIVLTGVATMPDGTYYLYKDPYLKSGITHMIKYDKFEKGLISDVELYRNNLTYWVKLMDELGRVTNKEA